MIWDDDYFELYIVTKKKDKAPFTLWEEDHCTPGPVTHSIFISGQLVMCEIIKPMSTCMWFSDVQDFFGLPCDIEDDFLMNTEFDLTVWGKDGQSAGGSVPRAWLQAMEKPT